MSVFVFLGPTLPVRVARRYLDAHYLPPAAQGDVLRVLDRAPSAIAIVDGYFELVPAVWHKEILLALEAGVQVFGAASMGALRAAELDAFGMKGVGEIYRAYASHRLHDDDEVAVTHGPAEHGYREFSEALVNIRDRCTSAARAGIITTHTANRFVAIAKALFYPNRRWTRLFDAAPANGIPRRDVGAMANYLKRIRKPPLKARDAIALLRRLSVCTKRSPRPFRPRVRTERTIYITRLIAEIQMPSSNGRPSRRSDRASGGHPDAFNGSARDLALLSILTRRESIRGSRRVIADDVRAVEERLRRDHDLLSGADTMQWLQDAGLSDEEFDDWMHDEALVDALRVRFAEAIRSRLPVEARRLRARELLASTNGAAHER